MSVVVAVVLTVVEVTVVEVTVVVVSVTWHWQHVALEQTPVVDAPMVHAGGGVGRQSAQVGERPGKTVGLRSNATGPPTDQMSTSPASTPLATRPKRLPVVSGR